MRLEQELEAMPIKDEVNYIIRFIKQHMELWNKTKLALVDKNTMADITFKQIYNVNKDIFNCELRLLDNLFELKDEELLINTSDKIEIDTKVSRFLANYTLNIFADYFSEYINEMGKQLGADYSNQTDTDYGKVSNKILSYYLLYLTKELDLTKMSKEDRIEFSNFLRTKSRKLNRNILNSFNAQHFEKINREQKK